MNLIKCRKTDEKLTSRKENYLSLKLMIRLQLKQREQVMQRIITCSPVLLFSCFQTRKNIADSLQIHVGFYTYFNNIFKNGMMLGTTHPASYHFLYELLLSTFSFALWFLSSMSHDSIVLFVRHSPCIMKVLHV